MSQEQELKELYKQLGKILLCIFLLWIGCIVLIYLTFTESNIEILKTINPDIMNIIFLLPIAVIMISVYFGTKNPGEVV